MGLFDGLNPMKVRANLELGIVLNKLDVLAGYLKDGTDKPSDLKLWEENMDKLKKFKIRDENYLIHAKMAYYTLFEIYLKKNHPDIID